MVLKAETIKSGKRIKANTKRVGRGNGSGKGTYASRGLKGQRARSGGKSGLQQRGFKQSLQKVPKLRGFKSKQTKPEIITLAMLEKIAGDEVITPFVLSKKRMISNPGVGVKVLASGILTKKVILKDCLATKKAVEMIEKAGGKLTF